ncbi:MAG TPA: adenine phosphoribosyltransferase [Bacteroidia bacterium]|jgi:adenine phosphoribosyltransferase|nr:adenine phosphoribosyltransferase [Bacteroidia bacterium]
MTDPIREAIRNVPDFPKPGILFKDITPLLQDPALGKLIVGRFMERLAGIKIDAICGVESRGFLFGYLLAVEMGVPFVPVRKSGKLPWKTIGVDYALEYGTARIEIHEDAIKPGMKVMIHDDLLATGGTAGATAKLVQMMKADVSAFTFVVELDFLEGRKHLLPYSSEVISLVNY